MFAKKNAEITEQVFEDISDEQLSQVTGGTGLVGGLLGGVLGTGTDAVSGVLGSVNASVSLTNGTSVNAAGIGVTLPGVNSLGLL
jgi:hypothetical protein